MSELARLSSREWRDYDRATMRLLAAKPGTDDFACALALSNATERALERADMLASGALRDAEIIECLAGVARALRGRVTDELARTTLAHVESALTQPLVLVPKSSRAPTRARAA